MKRPINLILTVLLALGLGFGIYVSVRGQLLASRIVTVHGVIGSEKEAFFRDPDVTAALLKHQLKVEFLKAGSREIATRDLSGTDFVFPAGVPASDAVRRRVKAQQVYDVFYTPVVVASFAPVLRVLEQNALATAHGSYGTLDLPALLKVMEAGTRWNALKGAAAYPSSRSVLVTTTDVRTSNSAAMYLGLVSNLLNGNTVAQASDLPALMPRVSPLFLRQGYQESSSAGPFEDYQALGAGKTPLVNIYESQFIEAARDHALPDGAVLLYPQPGIVTKHVLVPLTPAGSRLGEALTTDPDLQRLAARAGYRTRDAALFQKQANAAGLTVPGTIIDTVDLPSQEVLEAMISTIQNQYPK
ncbi:hypothetical protein [Deinococcus aquiradiocola]|uniref:Uncharacterized protein n=1 Tax=Deinococcus aquiradiocola TaxID=393059 RepID=A0A917UIG7_9DEIO|nr:hypothetical protein [Deinococcus aquiradiocola]GGJ60863.1 hypothetical protein GCM10008939_00800 [Deinococcus aquiradiocola]